MVGELFEHVGPRFGFARLEIGRNVDPLGFLAGAIFERIFEREVDEAADLLAVPDRNLASDQRRYAHWLERGQQVADASMCLVDAIDEDEMRYPEFVERAQRGRCEWRSGRVRIDDDDGDISNGQSPGAI